MICINNKYNHFRHDTTSTRQDYLLLRRVPAAVSQLSRNIFPPIVGQICRRNVPFLTTGAIIEQNNKTLQCIHVVIYGWKTWWGSQGTECCSDISDLITGCPGFPCFFLPPASETWNGVTSCEGMEEWQPSTFVRSQCHSHLVSGQESEVLSCVKGNPELINVQTSRCCHCKNYDISVYCADRHFAVSLPHSVFNMD